MATGVAFLHTESLKLETSPIRQTRVTKLFSPVCRCETSKARIAFRLGKPDVISTSIVDGSGNDVRLLASERPTRGRVAFLWNGRDDAGRVVPDGIYRARVRLDFIEKTYTLPNGIVVDSKRPVAKVVSVRPRVFSPDGDRRADRISVRYAVDQRARGMLYVDGVRRVVGSSLEPVAWSVRAGDRVERGQPLGVVQAASGHCSPAACVHWGVRRGEAYLDPLTLVPGTRPGPIVLLPDP